MAFGLIRRAPGGLLREPDLFSELWSGPFFRGMNEASAQFVPQIDAVEDENEYRVTAELPGLEEKDFGIVLEDGVLTLKGEKRSHYDSAEDESKDDSRTYRRVETSWGQFERRMRFDAPIDEDGVSASYKNGVLTVVVPKTVEARPQVRTIPVQSS